MVPWESKNQANAGCTIIRESQSFLTNPVGLSDEQKTADLALAAKMIGVGTAPAKLADAVMRYQVEGMLRSLKTADARTHHGFGTTAGLHQ